MADKKSTLQAKDFVHLHNHTQYSLLDGLTKVPKLIDEVKKLGMEAIAMTDHGNLSGAIEFYTTANAEGIKPIIGMEAYVAPRNHTDKDPAYDKQYYHLIILATNMTGYQNLMKLSTIAHLEGFYYKPRVDRKLLEKYKEGLIILSGCISGEFGDALRQGQYDQAKQTAEWYKSVFGENYYIEIQDHGHPDHPSFWQEQVEVNNQATKIAKELNLPMVITGDAHYLHKEDQEAHEILLCVQTGSFLSDTDRMSLKDFELHVADPKDVIKRWGKTHSAAIKNTSEIANKCSLSLSLGNILIPKFPVPKDETENSYLEKLVYQGLAWRYGSLGEDKAGALSIEAAKKTLSKEILDRAQYELDVINRMGFNGYFLIIADFMNWGKDKGIVFGPGRGSAAGSIIAYSLKITELDPLAYDLLFERFLNPDRISMPDIDIDIQDTRREEVIQYCIDKYGEDRVANIVTFGRMAARNAVRDVARVLQVPYAESDRLAKMIPPPVQGRHIPLEKSLKDNRELADEYASSEQSRTVFDLAIKLEGTIRSHGVHAAGVVIAPDEIVKFTPLEMAQKGVVSTQYSMGPIEEIGLLKMDFLGLSNLTIIKNALRIIGKVHKKDIDIVEIPLDDKKTFELFQRGDTTGVFQLESSGMKRYLKELKPTEFEDIIAMVALYRPGPLTAGLTDRFIARKNGREAVRYDHELMETALANTYGVLVYQEQVMQIVKDMCGFTGGEADTLRKAVGKKNRAMMSKMKDLIIKGAVANKVDKKIAEKFWTDLEGFADYAFNKSHAACYGMIAYQTAYLKAHYPAAFMAALMTSDFDDTDRLAIEINECRNMGVDVLPPDVRESFLEFAVIKDKESQRIRFGMSAIKNVGTGAAEEIIRVRETDKGFSSLEDFLSKINPRVVNRKTLESLVKAGAMDAFGDRGVLANNLDTMTAYSTRAHKDQQSGQVNLFSDIESSGMEVVPKLALLQGGEKYTDRQYLLWERELLGIYLSSHPLSEYETLLGEQSMPLNQLTTAMEGKRVKVGGSVADIREITTKKGQKMAFVKLTDFSGELELILFPGVLQKTNGMLQRDSIIMVDGKISSKDRSGNNGELKILAESVKEITRDEAINYKKTGKKKSVPAAIKTTTPSVSPAEQRVYVRLEKADDNDKLTKLKTIIDSKPGTTAVVLVVGADKQIIKLPTHVTATEELVGKITEVFGESAVKYQ